MAPGEESRALPVALRPRASVLAPVGHAGTLGERPFPALYWIVRAMCGPGLRRLFDLVVAGAEHLPPRGPYIVAANHHNYLDGVVLGVSVPHPIAFLVMPRVFHATPLHPAFHRRIGSIPLNLHRPAAGAIKRALELLESGGVIGIFPEGPFSQEGRLVEGQPGVAMIALRARVPVVPVAIRGTYEALRGRRFYLPRRHPLSVRFGPPIPPLAEPTGPITRQDRHEVTRRIMSAIEALLAAGEPAPRASNT